MQSSLSADVVSPDVIAQVEAGYKALRASDWTREVSDSRGNISYRAQLGEFSIRLDREIHHSTNARLTINNIPLRISVALANEMFSSVALLQHPQLPKTLSSELEDLLENPTRTLEQATISGLVYDHETWSSRPDGIVKISFADKQLTIELERLSLTKAISGRNPYHEITLRRAYGSVDISEDEAKLTRMLTAEQAGAIYRVAQRAFESQAAKVLNTLEQAIVEQISGPTYRWLSFKCRQVDSESITGEVRASYWYSAKFSYPGLVSDEGGRGMIEFYLRDGRSKRVVVRESSGNLSVGGSIVLCGVPFKKNVARYLAKLVERLANERQIKKVLPDVE